MMMISILSWKRGSHHDENRTVKVLAALERRAEELGVKHSPLPYTA